LHFLRGETCGYDARAFPTEELDRMADKLPLILLPAIGTTEALWRYQIESLSDITEISVGDLTRDDTISGMAASVLETAPERFALAGLSIGGWVAQEIMRQAPERVSRLALLDTSARADAPDRTEARRAQMALIGDGRFEEVVEQTIPFLLNPESPRDEALADIIRTMCRAVGPEAFIRQQNAAISRPDGRADLAKIDCPTLVLCGRQDQPIPLEMSEEIASGIKGAKLVAVEDCGHLSALEQPEAVSAAMRD
jgi:pimeloyl-ACP methyl ester carboxylesterase